MGLSTVDVCRTIREFGHEGMIEAIDHLDNRTRPGMASETADISADHLACEIKPALTRPDFLCFQWKPSSRPIF